jgi:hypothetical protein
MTRWSLTIIFWAGRRSSHLVRTSIPSANQDDPVIRGKASAVEPNFDHWGGEVVRLLEDHPNYGLKAGDAGYVWGVYNVHVFEGLLPHFMRRPSTPRTGRAST